jgi:signal transduction histidine kinase
VPIRPHLPGRSPGRPTAAAGLQAATIGHDIRNLLTAADLAVAMAMTGLEPGHSARPDLEGAIVILDRAARLAGRLLVAGRDADTGHDEDRTLGCDVAVVVRSIEPILRRLVRGDAELAVDTPGHVGRVPLDAAAIESLVVNLIVNARDAQPLGGRIELEVTGGQQAGTGRPTVRLTVADRGTGIDPAVRERMFAPRVTTKVGGSGLGLAIVADAVDAAGGTIVALDRRNGGTRFVVDLPRLAESGPAAARCPSATPPPVRTVGTFLPRVPGCRFEGES